MALLVPYYSLDSSLESEDFTITVYSRTPVMTRTKTPKPEVQIPSEVPRKHGKAPVPIQPTVPTREMRRQFLREQLQVTSAQNRRNNAKPVRRDGV